MGSGGTHFETLWPDVSPYMQTAGTGASASSTSPFIILVTDGVDNNQNYTPAKQSWTATPDAVSYLLHQRQERGIHGRRAVDSLCSHRRSRAHLERRGLCREQSDRRQLDFAGDAVLRLDRLFLQRRTAADINNAMLTIFYQAIGSARLTQ